MGTPAGRRLAAGPNFPVTKVVLPQMPCGVCCLKLLAVGPSFAPRKTASYIPIWRSLRIDNAACFLGSPMNYTRMFLLASLVLYSLLLLGIEFYTSQSFVRNFFTDIEGPVPFYAVNTTLSVFLLWATALLFAVCLLCIQGTENNQRLRLFFISQLIIFAWLGLDDRFKFHEGLAWRMGIGDHWILIAVAVIEVLCLVALGGKYLLDSGSVGHLFLAAGAFCVMIVIDAWFPHDMRLRLSCEDLAKTWAATYLFLFAWSSCAERIQFLQADLPRPSVEV